MKIATVAALTVLLSAGSAFAGAGAPVPAGSQKDPPSGRPGKVLSEAECTKAWETAGPDGDTLSEDKAAPYILNFQMVDTSKDAKISAEEWKAGCEKGWVSADASTAKDMEGTPAEPGAMDKKSSMETPSDDSSKE
jgi:hypothetical protein